MQAPTRYGLVGIGALALLSLVHWARGTAPPTNAAGAYLLGVTPNFAAAIAITFVALSIWSDQRHDANYMAAKRAFSACALMSCVGLLTWEFIQKGSTRFVFDPHDVGATFVGLAIAGLLFYALTPRLERGS